MSSEVIVRGATSGGQPVRLLVDPSGRVQTDTAAVMTFSPSSDAFGVGNPALFVVAFNYAFGGETWQQLRTPRVFKPQNAVPVATETTVWTPAAGTRFRLMGMTVASSVAGNLVFRDNTAGTIIASVSTTAGVPVPVDFGNGKLSAAANNVLTAQGPGGSTLSGMIFGTEET